MKIGNVDVSHAKGFVYDGCHKIYILFTDTAVKEEKKLRGGDLVIYPMDEIEGIYRKTCYLRFIDGIGDDDLYSIVPQCRNRVTFTYNTGKSVVTFK